MIQITALDVRFSVYLRNCWILSLLITDFLAVDSDLLQKRKAILLWTALFCLQLTDFLHK